ncbi:ubiquitin-like conjugating enzyme [Phellopilus nigrolimitatus]|nr:ubiquitin-like conjugating enzyme [Phellopilus nigrolimitatus]
MASAKSTIVQFTPFSSLVQPTFWHELTRVKIDVLRLSEDRLPVAASYSVGRSVTDRETGSEVDLGCHLTLGGEAFQPDPQLPPNSVSCTGTFKNFNTIEEFKAADKTALFNQTADEIWEGIKTTGDVALLNRFLLITFADLKKYKYYYWFAFPALVTKPAWTIGEPGWQGAGDVLGHDVLATAYFLARPASSSSSPSSPYEIAPLSEYAAFFASVPPAAQLVCFVDPSASAQHPGWPLRNVLAFLRARFLNQGAAQSRFGVVEVPADAPPAAAAERPAAVGWERNTQGKLGPRLADLAPMMDPARLADQAVDLNLKLMRWRILPALNLEKVAETRCLLLGAGTLGCYIARTLLAWGVRTITLVDSATVSFSNPVRQPLFEFADCLEGGKPKAQCAADSLKRIFPGVNAQGISLSIPMPGHPIPPGNVEQVKQDVAQLEKLVDEHDAVFLLMDSRESRWLPTVLGKAKGKIVMNTALGFDSYLVMRHGARADSTEPASAPRPTSKLGCYYCNDVVAPADSLTDRTLDQMCTVTRPGLAAIASATAVELLVSVLQHPEGANAPAPPPDFKDDSDEASPYRSVLGVVPHQLRGFLAQFRTLPIVGSAYDRCTGCSEAVRSFLRFLHSILRLLTFLPGRSGHACCRSYARTRKTGFAVLLRAFNEPDFLEALTGLDKLHNEGEAALESVDWDEDDDEM